MRFRTGAQATIYDVVLTHRGPLKALAFAYQRSPSEIGGFKSSPLFAGDT